MPATTTSTSRAQRESRLHAKRRQLAEAIEQGKPESVRRLLKEEIDAIKWLLYSAEDGE